jgi:hypothetical protein
MQRSATQTRGTGGFHCPGEDPEVLLDGGEVAIKRIEARQRLGFHGGATRVLGQARDLGVGFRGGGGTLNKGQGDTLTCGSPLGRWARGGLGRRGGVRGGDGWRACQRQQTAARAGGLRWAESDTGLQLLRRKGELG